VGAIVLLNHPFILRILGYSFPTSETGTEIQIECAATGALETVLKSVNIRRSPNFWNPNGIGIIQCGIIFGMRFVHAKGFIHRDLKPSTILIDRFGQALILDFGRSRLELMMPH
jgi:mitogen-activated protein kinase kinase